MNIPLTIYRALRMALSEKVAIKVQNIYQAVVGFCKYGDAHFPHQMDIEICTQCNRRCYYCPQSVEPTGVRFMADEVFVKIVNRLAELKWKWTVSFNFYNEPLLVPDLEGKVRFLLRHCPKALPSVTTNGDLLTEGRVRSLLDAGVCSFWVTRHPPYKSEWDGRIARLVEQFPNRIIFHCIENGELQTRGGMVKPKHPATERMNREGCFMPSCALMMTIDGDYEFCADDYHRKHLMGNVDSKSIKEAWFSEPWVTYRRAVRNRKPLLALCKKCFNPKNGKV